MIKTLATQFSTGMIGCKGLGDKIEKIDNLAGLLTSDDPNEAHRCQLTVIQSGKKLRVLMSFSDSEHAMISQKMDQLARDFITGEKIK